MIRYSIILIGGCLALASCIPNEYAKTQQAKSSYLHGVGGTSGVKTDIPPEARLGQGFWDWPAGLEGERRIVIDTKLQKVTYYVGDTIVGTSPVSTGTEGHATPLGTYKIIKKDKDYKSGTYGVLRSKATGAVVNGDFNNRAGSVPAGCYYDPAPMPYYLSFLPGYGMHQGFVAGYPVSHGCVRMPEDMARVFFENTPMGTTVVVK